MNAVQKVSPITKELSMTPSAVRSRAKRAATPAKKPVVKVTAAQKRTLSQFCAALAAGFLPVASFVIAHYESKTNPVLWLLVGAALLFSAPTLAGWAQKWCQHQYKAWGFTILLEGVMVFSHEQLLSFAGLAILVLINASNAWQLSSIKPKVA